MLNNSISIFKNSSIVYSSDSINPLLYNVAMALVKIAENDYNKRIISLKIEEKYLNIFFNKFNNEEYLLIKLSEKEEDLKILFEEITSNLERIEEYFEK